MSREIKFRVWDKDLKKMHICGENQHDSISFSYLENEAHYYNLQNGCGSSTDGSGTYELMQYTGLKDKNGKEIFEGDVVKCFKIHNSIVCMAEYAWGLKTKTLGFIPFSEIYGHFEVIGNIYENPELLEGTA